MKTRMNSRQMKRKFGTNTKELMSLYQNIQDARIELKNEMKKSGSNKITIDMNEFDHKMDDILGELGKKFPVLSNNKFRSDDIKIHFNAK